MQLSVLIGKIARLDCPRNWPELIPALIDVIKAGDSMTQQRATLTFYYVIKSLASRRLAADRKFFEDVRLVNFSPPDLQFIMVMFVALI